MNEQKFKQQELLCRNGLDTKKCNFVYNHFVQFFNLKINPTLKTEKKIYNVDEINDLKMNEPTRITMYLTMGQIPKKKKKSEFRPIF